jgi:hypothetical protein
MAKTSHGQQRAAEGRVNCTGSHKSNSPQRLVRYPSKQNLGERTLRKEGGKGVNSTREMFTWLKINSPKATLYNSRNKHQSQRQEANSDTESKVWASYSLTTSPDFLISKTRGSRKGVSNLHIE